MNDPVREGSCPQAAYGRGVISRSDASVGVHACSCAVVPGPSREQRGGGDTAAPTGLAVLIRPPQATPSRERALYPSAAPRLCVAERHRPAGSRPHVCASSPAGSSPELCFPVLWGRLAAVWALSTVSVFQEAGHSRAETRRCCRPLSHQARRCGPGRALHPDLRQRGQVPGSAVSERQATAPVQVVCHELRGGAEEAQTAQGHRHRGEGIFLGWGGGDWEEAAETGWGASPSVSCKHQS